MLVTKRILVTVSLIIVIPIVPIARAKSVYVINDTDSSQMQVYKIDGTSLVYQTQYDFVSQTWGPVGIAIDKSSYGEFLFVTFEGQNDIEVVNAKTLQYVDTIEAPDPYGTLDLAGIVVSRQKILA